MKTYLQMHPHDLLIGREGLEKYFSEIGPVTGIVIGINTVPEVHPIINGINKGERYDPGLWYPPVHNKTFRNLCHLADHKEAFHEGLRFLEDLVGSDNVVLWVSLLYGGYDNHHMISLDGNTIQNWVCPNQSVVSQTLQSVLAEVASMFPGFPIMLDRIRFPDWTSSCGLEGMAGCFCEECMEDMAGFGMDPIMIKQKWMDARGQGEDGLTSIFQCLDMMRNWRTKVIAEFVDTVAPSHVNIWPDIWPPDWAQIFGQPLDGLSKYHTFKVQAYRKLAGGADLRILVGQLSQYLGIDDNTVFAKIEHNLGHPWHADWERFRLSGYGSDYISYVLNRKNENTILLGIQAWDTTSSEAMEDIALANEFGADGVIIYCFGWVEVSELTSMIQFARGLT